MTYKFALVLITGFIIGLLVGETALSDSEPALIAQGRLLFEETAGGDGVGCAVCHGHFGMGDEQIGPNNRGASEERIRKALTTVDRMSFLHLTDEEINAVAAFLGYLGKLHPVKITIDDSKFEPNNVSVPANRLIQFIFNNKGNEACNFSINGTEIKEKRLELGRVDDAVWTSPAAKKTLTAQCGSRATMVLTIVVEEK